MIQHVFSGFVCVVQDFHNYTETITACDEKQILTFDVSTWDRPPNDLIDQTKNVHTISVYYQSLQSLDNNGFCDWPHLIYINANGNNITSLPSRVLIDCRSLEMLTLWNNDMNEIHNDAFYGLTSLTTLELTNNQLTHLSSGVFKSLTSLLVLRLDSNHLQAIDANHFQYNINLESLYLHRNEIKVIERGSFWKLKKLDELYLSDNQDLNSIDLTQMDRLSTVSFEYNEFIQLHIPKCLTYVSALDCKIEHLTIEPNSALESLHLGSNFIRNVSVLSNARHLKVLDISNNSITDIDFSLLSTEIIVIDLRWNPIKTFNVQGLKMFKSIKQFIISMRYLDNQTLTDLKREANQRKFILNDDIPY